MTIDDGVVLRVESIPHPDARVRRVGWPLTHPYLEQCWVSVLGPTSVLVLRRLAMLTHDDRVISIPLDELAVSLGLGSGTGRHAAINRTLERIVAFRFATWMTAHDLAIFQQMPVLANHQLSRAPRLTRELHDGLVRSARTHLALDNERQLR